MDDLVVAERDRPVIAAWVLAFSCRQDPEPVDTATHDSGGPFTLPQCADTPCASDVALATYEGQTGGENVGFAVATQGGKVLVGAPRMAQAHGPTLPYAALLDLDLVPLRQWDGSMFTVVTGASVAFGPAASGTVAVGQAYGPEFSGALMLDDRSPTGSIQPAAHLLVRLDANQHGGAQTRFAQVGADATDWLVVGASGASGLIVLPGELLAVPADAVGEYDVTTVPLRITGEPGFGQNFEPWDADGDGIIDLATAAPSGVYHFQGPWVGHLTDADRTGAWDEPAGRFADAGSAIRSVGDLTGDGADDLAFSSPDWGEEPYRTGRAYVVPGGTDLSFGSVVDLPIQFHGVREGEGMGWGLAGADFSGDGLADLVVGASGVSPGDLPGSVLLFPGPLAAGTWDASLAAGVIYGEYPYDLFGRAMAPVDADGDAQVDLLVGAHGWPGGYGNGKVYLLPGSALTP